MNDFTICIAGITVRVSPLFPETAQLYRDYISDGEAIFSVSVTGEKLEKERAVTAELAKKYPKQFGALTDAFLDGQSVYRQIAERLPEYNVLLFHGSAVAVDGAAYLFTAPSGTGKSTHTRLWRRCFGERAVMINDDKPLLKFENGAVLACGSPWQGKHRLGTNISIPLKGLCLLTRDVRNSIATISPEEAFPALIRQCYLPENPGRTSRTLELLERLTQNVPLYLLKCNMETEAAQVAYMGMNRVIDL